MPVTKTAKRALRGSQRKQIVNDEVRKNLEIAVRAAKKKPQAKAVSKAFSIADRAAKHGIIHRNKAARIKSALAALLGKKTK